MNSHWKYFVVAGALNKDQLNRGECLSLFYFFITFDVGMFFLFFYCRFRSQH